MPPPPPPKSFAPTPPKTKAPRPPPPPPGGGNKRIKSKSKPKSNQITNKKKALLSLNSKIKPSKIKKAKSANIYKPTNGYNNKPQNVYKPRSNQKKFKPPPPPKMKKNNKNGVSNRVKMFQQIDRTASKEKNIDYNKPPSQKKPSELKLVNADWKQHRNKMKNVLKKKADKNDKNMFAVKSNKPKPKKLEFNLFKKSKSAEIIDINEKTHVQAVVLTFSKSADINKKMLPPPPPPDALKRNSKPALPLPPVPRPKAKAKVRKGGGSILKQGVLEVMPSKKANGWVYNRGGMFKVSYKDINDIKKNNIFEGSPVIFDSIDKNAKHLRLLTQLDMHVVQQCMTKKGKTKYDARYYIYDTELEFNGNLSGNAFETVVGEFDGKQFGKMSEKIINAFINTNGGTLYFGIDKSCNIVGVLSKYIDSDRVKQFVMMNVNRFEPKLRNTELKKFKFTTTAIMTKDGKLCENIMIIKIIVPGPFKNDNNERITYSTANGDKFKKKLNYIMKVVM